MLGGFSNDGEDWIVIEIGLNKRFSELKSVFLMMMEFDNYGCAKNLRILNLRVKIDKFY